MKEIKCAKSLFIDLALEKDTESTQRKNTNHTSSNRRTMPTHQTCSIPALLFDATFLIIGCAAMVMAGVVVQDEVGQLSGHGISTGLILIGALLTIVSLISAQASLNGDLQKWSFYYSVILLFVLVATCVLSTLSFQEATVKENLSSGWNVVDSALRKTVEQNLKCCGFNKVHDRSVVPCNFVDPCEPKLHALVDARMSIMRAWSFGLLSAESVGFFIALYVLWKKMTMLDVSKRNHFGEGIPSVNTVSYYGGGGGGGGGGPVV